MEDTQEFQWILDEEPAVEPHADTVTVYSAETDFASSSDNTQNSLPPLYPVAEPYLGTAAFPPVPEPPVNTAPRPTTIVLGFIVMALGIVAISLAAGAAVDLGLVLVWLPAICGIALILAAIAAAVRRPKLQ